MSLRQRIHDNTVLTVLFLLATGFAFGYNAYEHVILKIYKMETVSKEELNRLKSEISKKAQEIDRLKEDIKKVSNISNDNDVNKLQVKITAFEAEFINLQKKYENIISQKDQEIANLTSKIQKIGPMSNSLGSDNKPQKDNSPSLQQQKIKPFFTNNIIKIEIVSFSLDGAYFNLLLKHTNLTEQPIEIFAYEHKHNTLLIDNHNNQCQYLAPYEIGKEDVLYLSDKGRGIELAPGIPKVISFSFACNNKQHGSNFIFSSKYGFRYKRGISNVIHVSIKNINLN